MAYYQEQNYESDFETISTGEDDFDKQFDKASAVFESLKDFLEFDTLSFTVDSISEAQFASFVMKDGFIPPHKL